MTINRSATDKLIWYFYQFDRTILELLELGNNSDEITVEWLEDIDINGFSWWENIQVKYYTSKKIILDDWTLSTDKEIWKSILLLMMTFLNTWKHQTLLWYYQWQLAQEKVLSNIELDAIITKSKWELNLANQWTISSLTQQQKIDFIDKFKIKIVDKNYDEQLILVKSKLSEKFSLSWDEEIELYYNYWLSNIIQLTANLKEDDRKITKQQFTEKINKKESLFSFWFLELKEDTEYFKFIKKKFFRWTKEIIKYERIILLETKSTDTIEEIKHILKKIENRFNNVVSRTRKSPVPYIYLRNITTEKLLELKNNLWSEQYLFEDWHYYKWDEFQITNFTKFLEHNSNIKIRIINESWHIEAIISNITDRTLELIDFYQTKPIDIRTDKKISSIFIKDIDNLNNLF